MQKPTHHRAQNDQIRASLAASNGAPLKKPPRTTAGRRTVIKSSSHSAISTTAAHACGQAVGELAEGRYDEWLAAERERLAGLYLEALERLARQYERNRCWPEAVRCAERLVAHDPLREEAHRLLIRVCRESGDRARAVRAYHACAATLERELGIEPSSGTRAMYQSLVAATPAGTAPPGAAAGGAGHLARRHSSAARASRPG